MGGGGDGRRGGMVGGWAWEEGGHGGRGAWGHLLLIHSILKNFKKYF